MKIFAFGLLVQVLHSDDVVMNTGVIFAESDVEASGQAYRFLHKEYPPALGYINHLFVLSELDQGTVNRIAELRSNND